MKVPGGTGSCFSFLPHTPALTVSFLLGLQSRRLCPCPPVAYRAGGPQPGGVPRRGSWCWGGGERLALSSAGDCGCDWQVHRAQTGAGPGKSQPVLWRPTRPQTFLNFQSVAFAAAPIAGDMIFFPACNAGSRHALSHSTLAHGQLEPACFISIAYLPTRADFPEHRGHGSDDFGGHRL